MRIPRNWLPSLSVVLLSICVLLLDVQLGLADMVRQALTARYARTTGTVIRSEVLTLGYSKSGEPYYRLHVLHRYEVNGGIHNGSTHRYSSLGESDSVDALRGRFPAGATVPVFYDPENPTQAVLQSGLQRGDLLKLSVMTPFHLLVLVIWVLGARASSQRQSVHSFVVKGRTHVSLAATDRLGTALWLMWSVSWVPLLMMLPLGFNPSGLLLLGGWGALGLTGVAVALWYRSTQGASDFDLILDERRERLSVPAMFGRTERLNLALSRIQFVSIEEHITKDSEGDPVSRWRPLLTISWEPGGITTVTLAEYRDLGRAEVLARWLHSRLRLDGGDNPVVVIRAA